MSNRFYLHPCVLLSLLALLFNKHTHCTSWSLLSWMTSYEGWLINSEPNRCYCTLVPDIILQLALQSMMPEPFYPKHSLDVMSSSGVKWLPAETFFMFRQSWKFEGPNQVTHRASTTQLNYLSSADQEHRLSINPTLSPLLLHWSAWRWRCNGHFIEWKLFFLYSLGRSHDFASDT